MKKLLLLSGLIAVSAVCMFTSCSKDVVLDNSVYEPNPLEEDTSFFVNVNILGADAMTRAEGDEIYDATKDPSFDKGEEGENQVNTIYLVFYDKDGNRVSTTQVRKDNAIDHGTFTNETDSRNSFYSGVVQIDVKHGSLPPAYVMAFINPISSQNFDINPDFESLDAVSRTTRPRIMGENGNFAMSKSVYYGIDRTITDSTNPNYNKDVKIVATPLMTENANGYMKQLFTSYDEALGALDQVNSEKGDKDDYAENSSVVNIYVERYAAKVNFEIDSSAYDSSEKKMEIKLNEGRQGLKEIVLTFIPEYWAVNDYESDTYIVKSFLNK